jgi:hypothetical protein
MGGGIGPYRRPAAKPAKHLENRAFWGLGRGGGAWGIPQPQPLQAMPPWVGAFGEPGEKSGCVSFN